MIRRFNAGCSAAWYLEQVCSHSAQLLPRWMIFDDAANFMHDLQNVQRQPWEFSQHDIVRSFRMFLTTCEWVCDQSPVSPPVQLRSLRRTAPTSAGRRGEGCSEPSEPSYNTQLDNISPKTETPRQCSKVCGMLRTYCKLRIIELLSTGQRL